MDAHAVRINLALQRLVDEFRLGVLSAEDYRVRRRAIFRTWGDRDVTTSPPDSLARTQPVAAASTAAPSRWGSRLLVAMLWGALIGVVAFVASRRLPF